MVWSMDPTFLVLTVQAGGGSVTVWGMVYWTRQGPSVPILWEKEACLAKIKTRCARYNSPQSAFCFL